MSREPLTPSRPEAGLLLGLARAALSDEQVAELREQVAAAPDLDWGYLIDQAYQHKVLPLVARNILTYRPYPSTTDKRRRFRHERFFRLVYDANAARNDALLRELSALLRAFDRAGLPVVVRKGAVLGQEVYHDLTVRQMSDMDFMVEPGDLDRVRQVLTEMGYLLGNPSRNRRVITPLPRAEALYWAMQVPNVVYRRPTSERFVEYFMVDISLNQFLPASGYDLPAGRLAERSRPILLAGTPARCFVPTEMLIDLATHLYKEATALYFVELGKDLNLSKFLDLAEFAGAGGVDWDDVVATARRYGIEEPVYFSLHFTDLLYPEVVSAGALAALRPADDAYLEQFGFADKDVHTWRRSFAERLFDLSRVDEARPSRSMV